MSTGTNSNRRGSASMWSQACGFNCAIAIAVGCGYLIAAATIMLWHPSTKLSAETVGMPSLLELQAARANTLPNQEIEDQSLIFPNVVKR
jgi:hypothetical protein